MSMVNEFTRALFEWFIRHRKKLLIAAVIVMSASATVRLLIEFSRLVIPWEEQGGADLLFRYHELHRWFEGKTVYDRTNRVYPPASYVILWPLLGWLSPLHARWMWGIAAALSLVWLARFFARESEAGSAPEKAFVVLLLLSMNGTGLQVGHGQLSLPLLPFLLMSLFLLQKEASWKIDLLIAALFCIALVKPTITGPFFWLVLFVPGRIRPAVLTVLLYVSLTLVAASFQHQPLTALIDNWLAGSHQTVRGFTHGYGNVQSWLEEWNFISLAPLAPPVLLLFFGVWVYFNRMLPLWLLIAITAIFSRVWAYHLMYDDFMIILAMIALFQIAKRNGSTTERTVAGLLLAFTAFLNMARLTNIPPMRFAVLIRANQAMWLLILVFLLFRANRLRKSTSAAEYNNSSAIKDPPNR